MAKIVRHEELSPAASLPTERLQSWKEIAAYLRRDVRTVQRWEKQEGLPVHRHVHNKLSSVYAEKSELEAWWKNRKAQLEEERKVDEEVIAPVVWRRGRMLVWTAVLLAIIIFGGSLWLMRPPPRLPGQRLIAVPLTAYPGRELEPSFSPDGSQIAFCWNGEKQDNFDIYVKLVGPGDPFRLTEHPARDRSPAWSPDGRYIAFIRSFSARKATVFLVPALGGMERRVSDINGFGFALEVGTHLTWSIDSKWLVVPDKISPKEPYGLFLLSIETGDKRRLTTPPAESIGDSNPSFSPTGHRLAFTRDSAMLMGDLYLLTLGEGLKPQGDPRRLTFDNKYTNSPTWTSDESEVLFSSGEDGRGLWRIKANGVGGAVALEFEGSRGYQPEASPQGRRLAYTQQVAVDINVWRAELPAPGGPARNPISFISSSVADYHPEYSPDGKKIAFVSFRAGKRSIWVCEKDGSKPAQVTSLGGLGPSWSPDSQRIAFASNTDGQWEIYVADLQGGQPQRLTTHESSDFSPSWSRDGRWVYFLSNRSGNDQVWKVPAGGGQALQVTQQGGSNPLESPDGTFVYYSKSEPNSLWKVPSEGGKETLVLEALELKVRGCAIVNEGIYFAVERSRDPLKPGPGIDFFSFATTEVRPVLAIEKPIWYGLSVSPDGKSILYTQIDHANTDIMLVENFH